MFKSHLDHRRTPLLDNALTVLHTFTSVARNALFSFTFYVVLLVYGVCFALFGWTVDSDFVARSTNVFNIGVWWAKLLSATSPYLGAVCFGLTIALIITYSVREKQWAVIVFFTNPFVIKNCVDVYNRFCIALALAFLVSAFLRSDRKLRALMCFSVFSLMHPLNFCVCILLLLPPVVISVPFVSAAIHFIPDIPFFDIIFREKVILVDTFGADKPLLAGGNFKVDPNLFYKNELFWIIGIAFPGAFLHYNTFETSVVAFGYIFWYIALLAMLNNRWLIISITVSLIIIISLFVGNSAVAHRHLLPAIFMCIVTFGRMQSNISLWRGILRFKEWKD